LNWISKVYEWNSLESVDLEIFILVLRLDDFFLPNQLEISTTIIKIMKAQCSLLSYKRNCNILYQEPTLLVFKEQYQRECNVLLQLKYFICFKPHVVAINNLLCLKSGTLAQGEVFEGEVWHVWRKRTARHWVDYLHLLYVKHIECNLIYFGLAINIITCCNSDKWIEL
jgi:hypothetical protein